MLQLGPFQTELTVD